MKSSRLLFKGVAATLVMSMLLLEGAVVSASGKIAGEILVADRGAAVTVNGEVVKSGRSIFSGSTIDTPASAGAVLSLGTAGRIELAPGSSFTVSFDDSKISGLLSAGKVTVISSTEKVKVETADGKVSELSTGESSETSKQQDDTATSKGGGNWWIWTLVFGGAVTGVVLASITDNNRTSVGGGTTIVSPSR